MSQSNPMAADEVSDEAVVSRDDHWHIIESSDRWYQAHQRCVATSVDSRGAFVRRWSGKTLLGLITHLRQTTAHRGETGAASTTYLVWDFPLADSTPELLFDVVANISELCPHAIQMAHASKAFPLPVLLALQEAGISVMLNDLWTLQRIIQRIDSQSSAGILAKHG